jgi:hypothetical protein
MKLEMRWPELAVLVPILGLMGLIARAEIALRAGEAFRIPITGYDPRDLLHGHYLQYSYAFDWQGQSTCGVTQDGRPAALTPGCCVCLTRGAAEEATPAARQLDCDEARRCDGWLHVEPLMPPLRYFVPEQHARQLEQALLSRRAALDVTCSPGGQPALGELYLDGQSWRELVSHPPGD